ncbi:MAG: SDR family NAD(P)-dependent oxidoreductase [Bacteroidales bacterium]
MGKKTILIVGATSGIGYATAKIYINQGWRVGVVGRNIERLHELKAFASENVEFAQIDTTKVGAELKLMELIDRMGGIDILLLSSGCGKQNIKLDVGIEQMTLELNVIGFTRIVDAAYHYFKGIGGGHIAVISSIAGTKGLGVAASYSATKGFQNKYIESLTQLSRMQGDKVIFTDIRPGFVNTPLLAGDKHYPMAMTADYVATKIVKGIKAKRKVLVIDWRYAILVFFWRMIPRWLWIRLGIKN